MKAIILAAGKGERINNITQTIPKPMIVVNGKPILQHNIELCKKFGITDIFINVHHLSDIITDFFGNGEKFGVNISYSIEETLHGTSGAVRKIAKDLWNLDIQKTTLINSPITPSPRHSVISSLHHYVTSDAFFVLYGDNFSDYNLSLLELKAVDTNALAIIGFHYRKDTSTSGVAEFDQQGKVLKFIEKPKNKESDSHWVNAGIYYLTPSILEFIPEQFSDFGKDIFPDLLQRGIPIYGICEDIEVKAFDTYEMIEKNK